MRGHSRRPKNKDSAVIATRRSDFFGPSRPTVILREAAVATSHPLATGAALEMLQAGGNAMDAALAAVATQCVVEPAMTGIGGDCFVLYAPSGKPTVAMNGSGCAPAAATVEALRSAGLGAEIPRTSAHAVTVPGAVSAWTRLHADHGSLPLDRLFARAVDYAENGYPIGQRVAFDWAEAAPLLAQDTGAAALFLPAGKPLAPGARHAQPRLGQRLREIAAHGARAFYEGATAASLVQYLKGLGGLHTLEDFAGMTEGAFYTAPISSDYRGYTVEQCPPNGQGLAALMLLNILREFDLGEGLSTVDRIHLHAEATKLAYHSRDALLADPAAMTVPIEELLSHGTARRLAALVDMKRARPHLSWDEPVHQDTVYVCAVDRDGNMVSFINSLFHAFGSTHLDPTTGVLLHSRGASFRLIEGHPNAIGPRKRPMHTIIPGLLRRDGQPAGVFGVMGGHYQAAGHAALLSGLFDRGLDPQAAVDAPRSFAHDGILDVEPTYPEGVAAELSARGHRVETLTKPLGGAQVILRDPTGGFLLAASDPRKDGCALGV
ncbi:gamma-glutamyltransferase family protein [Aurantimonas sp. HBX-1]|uniref:gamma-glutamyltransferase family protein n=1 Tax=Aurantimonas sp. HBX-1 TaxID=2906072 RepID=UPI001F164EAB|nr:gamma-glutamyltransferase family protein [Aurantimonas sp. HBX-1]UIJ72233.1 gamma-glutamyltransferase family protein [Aurantimonas sp. HBX-1]